ncbi:MAG: prolyl oligopeptidase family serine peptidase [Acidobacteriota bacterium]
MVNFRSSIIDDYHGTPVEDPYRWLEGSDAPELASRDEELDRAVQRWTQEQNQRSRRVLDELPQRPDLERRLQQLYRREELEQPSWIQGRLFYFHRPAGSRQPRLEMREGLEGEPRVLVNPLDLAEDGLTALAYAIPDRAGKRVVYGLFRAGDEHTVLHLLDADDGRPSPLRIPGKVDGISWLPDGESFVYHRLGDPRDPYSRQVRWHRLGSDPKSDAVLLAQEAEGPLAHTWGPFGYPSPDARWLILGYWSSTRTNHLWVADFEHYRRTGELQRRQIFADGSCFGRGPVVGDTLYLHTTSGAPGGRVVAVDLRDPQAPWREVVGERDDATLDEVHRIGNSLLLHYLHRAASRLERVTFEGAPLPVPSFQEPATVEVRFCPGETKGFLVVERFTRPPELLWVDLEAESEPPASPPSTELGKSPRKRPGELIEGSPSPPLAVLSRPFPGGRLRQDSAADDRDLVTEQVAYTSADGTEVLLFLVRRRDLQPTGDIPTMLTGYGGFNISMSPEYRPLIRAWVESGGLCAVANLRGGGEHGDAWHEAGTGARKQRVFDDFLAAAEYLVSSGWTQPQHLGIRGGSNGGLLTGAAVVQRPDLFGAVISAVPLLDMLRFQHFLMARFWVPEYGSSEHAEDLQHLLAYSPYHNVQDGVPYPAVLITAAENDARVHPLHARKMAARLQHAIRDLPDAGPVLLYIETDTGHGQGRPLDLQIRSTADELSFLTWRLGLEAGAGGWDGGSLRE